MRAEIAGYIRDNLIAEGQPKTIEEDESLIERGILDSMALMDLIMFIEERTGVRVPDSEVTLENFETAARIVDLVTRLRNR